MKNNLKRALLSALILAGVNASAMEKSWLSNFKSATAGIWRKSFSYAAKNITRETIQEHKKEIVIGTATAGMFGIVSYYAHWYLIAKPRYQRELTIVQSRSVACARKIAAIEEKLNDLFDNRPNRNHMPNIVIANPSEEQQSEQINHRLSEHHAHVENCISYGKMILAQHQKHEQLIKQHDDLEKKINHFQRKLGLK